MFRYRKEERCSPLVLQAATKNEFRSLNSNSTCSINRKEEKQGLTANPVSVKKKCLGTNNIDIQSIGSKHHSNGSPNQKHLLFKQKSFDIPPTFESQDRFPGIACAYEQRSRLLFVGGGYDPTKTELSRVAQGKNISNLKHKYIYNTCNIFVDLMET